MSSNGVSFFMNYLIVPFVLLPSLVALIFFIKYIYSTLCGPLAKIPGPQIRAFSILPHLNAMWTGAEAVSVVKLHEEYGPVVRIAPDLVGFIGDELMWKTIYGSKSQGRSTFKKDTLFYDEPFNRVMGPFGAEEDTSLRMRKTMAPAFSDQGLKQYEPRMKGWCAALRQRLAQYAREEQATDMVKMFNCTTFDVMSDMLLSEPLHMLEKGEYVPHVRLIFTILRHVTRFKTFRFANRGLARQLHRLMMRIPSVKAHAEQHHRFIASRVDERLCKQPEQPDIWKLVTAESSTASMISQEERYSIANELMIAGTETSATTLSGVLYYLLKNPHWLHTLTEDLRSQCGRNTVGEEDENFTMATLQANKLLDAIIKEGMRLYPPVPIGFPRFVPQGGAEIAGYYLPEGTRVAIYHLATYRDENLWLDADSFRPERWLGDERFKNDCVGSFEPFSTGLRGCSGKNFAWHEMRLILASILLHFDFELHPESENWIDQKTFLVWEKPPLMVKVKERVMHEKAEK